RSINARGVGAFFSDPALFTLRAVLAWRGDSAPQSEPGRAGPRLSLQITRGY
ncbi:MAG: hypothetical protein RLZZ584_4524, partial [Pseudomonadota bacterium]